MKFGGQLPTNNNRRSAMTLIHEEFKNENGVATWWEKDGLWHIARPGTNMYGEPALMWTFDQFETREEAIAALK
jgi:hypothetical protein